MSTRKVYKFEQMQNRALHRVQTLIDLAQLHPGPWQREVRYLAAFYGEGYPTPDREGVERDAESVAALWLQERFKKLQAREDEEQDDQI